MDSPGHTPEYHIFTRRNTAKRTKIDCSLPSNTKPFSGWYTKPAVPIASYRKTFNPLDPYLAVGQ
nr:L [Oscivirus A2] [Oscivirus A2]